MKIVIQDGAAPSVPFHHGPHDRRLLSFDRHPDGKVMYDAFGNAACPNYMKQFRHTAYLGCGRSSDAIITIELATLPKGSCFMAPGPRRP